MPEITDSKYLVSPGISDRRLRARPCIVCGGERDHSYGYTTNQGKRSIRTAPRCKGCEAKRRAARWDRDREKERRQMAGWRSANKDRLIAYRGLKQQDPEHRALKAYHQRLRKARMRSGQKDDEAIRAIYRQAEQENKLAMVCPLFAIPELGRLQVDHVIPLARGGQHIAANLQILAAGLNMRKGVSCPK